MSSHPFTQYPLLVLVVDDDIDTVESQADLLSLQGHTVRTARNGEEALTCAETERPDVVLLDIRMPGQNGCDVARAIRKNCAGKRQPIIIAVTGCSSEDDLRRSEGAGFDLHLVKPVEPAILVGVLERIRRLLTPPIPAAELDHPSEDPPDGWQGRHCCV
ncbi:Gliding motility regulatory protein [Gemmata sp. SH-PL17]|uniref:response regulator n=1 Tax=Gemmata sp. SH-PL17 TaxID=1630693 RepID=UPI00078C7FD6|nr:response regulator [Gemmata sp. SH-PL17]AMV23327.1 Gliding motility regulatory protein [Gemmata sp. SH-PL17]